MTTFESGLRFHRAVLAGGRNGLWSQMRGLISIGLAGIFRKSTGLYDASLPLYGRVFDAILGRHRAQGRENMAKLLSSTREFLEREPAGLAHEGAEEEGTLAR